MNLKRLLAKTGNVTNRMSLYIAAWFATVMAHVPFSEVIAADASWAPSEGSKTVDKAADSLTGYIYKAVIIIFMLGGAISVGIGIFKAMNKESNPQGAQGAWKLVVGGALLLAFTVVLGILMKTVKDSV